MRWDYLICNIIFETAVSYNAACNNWFLGTEQTMMDDREQDVLTFCLRHIWETGKENCDEQKPSKYDGDCSIHAEHTEFRIWSCLNGMEKKWPAWQFWKEEDTRWMHWNRNCALRKMRLRLPLPTFTEEEAKSSLWGTSPNIIVGEAAYNDRDSLYFSKRKGLTVTTFTLQKGWNSIRYLLSVTAERMHLQSRWDICAMTELHELYMYEIK